VGFTGLRQSNRRSNEGILKAMSTRMHIGAIERTAGTAGSAATLILDALLLLTGP